MQSKLRVAHCLEQVRSGGVERRRLSLARRLDPARFEQMVICTEASAELRARFEEAGCPVAEIGAMKRGVDWPKVRAAAKLLREFRPHIVHGAVFEGVILAALAGKLARVPAIVVEETIAPVGRRWAGHLYYRLLIALSDRVVAISEGVATYLTKRIRMSGARVRLIVNGVPDPGPAAPGEVERIREMYGLTAGAPVIGTVGRLGGPARHGPDSHKRISDAIAALPLVLERFPDARLLIVGDGPDRAFLERRAADVGLGESIVFAGFQPDVRPFLECMDVLVHPSETEGLPLTLVEAMFASRPVVATDVPGSNEVVVDGETGFLVPLRDPRALAEKVITLLGQPELRAAMGAAGLRRARERFSEERYIREVAALYEELAAESLRR